jgi:hypothetical protein
MLIAKCKKNIDPWGDKETDLVVDREYVVERVDMGQSYTTLKLLGKDFYYNSVMFDFYEEDKEIDIYSDERYNPYLRRLSE